MLLIGCNLGAAPLYGGSEPDPDPCSSADFFARVDRNVYREVIHFDRRV